MRWESRTAQWVSRESNQQLYDLCHQHRLNFGLSDLVDLNLDLNRVPLTPPQVEREIEIIDLLTPESLPPPMPDIHLKPNGSTISTVGDSTPTPARDPVRVALVKSILDRLKLRQKECNIAKLVVPCDSSFKKADDHASLQAACINLCQKSKSDKVLLMLYECLYRWMLRKKQLIPRAILRQIQEQIQKFAKLKRIPIFDAVSLWAIHDKGHNLN